MREWDRTHRRPTRKDEVRRNHRRWYQVNRDQRRQQIRRYHEENAEALRVAAAKWRAENRDAIRAYFASPEGRRAKNRAESKRRAIKKGAPVRDLAAATEYRSILAGDPCCYCGQPSEQVDHIDPLANGGPEAWDNLTAACASCNGRKSARDLLTFLAVLRDSA